MVKKEAYISSSRSTTERSSSPKKPLRPQTHQSSNPSSSTSRPIMSYSPNSLGYHSPFTIQAPPPAPGARGAESSSSSSNWNNGNHGFHQGTGMLEDQEDDEDDDEEDDEDEEDEDASDFDQQESLTAGNKRKRGGNTTQSKGKGKANSSNQSAASKKAAAAAAGGNSNDPDVKKPKPTRGSKACQKCRALKMRCIVEHGPPCQRCAASGHECIFVESNRGKKGGKSQKTEQMAQSLKAMESTLSTLLKAIRDPSSRVQQSGGIITRPSSPLNPLLPGLSTLTEAEKEKLNRGWRPDSEGDGTNRFYPSGSSNSNGNGGAGPSSSHSNTNHFDPSSGINMSSLDGKYVHPNDFATHLGGPTLDMSASNNQDRSTNGIINHNNNSNPNTSTSTSKSGPSTRFSEPMPHYRDPRTPSTPSDQQQNLPRRTRHGSPRLHSLPDNALNPLGLLAEASLHNSNRVRRSARQSSAGSKDRSVSGSVHGQSPALNSVKVEGEEAGNESSEKKSSGNGSEKGSNNNETPAYGNHSFEFPSIPEGSGDKEKGKGREKSSKAAKDDEERVSLGVASETYFKPGPMTILPLRRIIIERERPPEILTSGLVSSHEVLELFSIFFHHCAQHMLLLDADWHTPSFVFSRSAFLFTCVCTVAAKFYTKRPELHAKCLAIAKKVALDCIGRGYKSVEIVQGFLLLVMWNQPSERWEEDKTWIFSGIAIRMAQDLNLHRKSVASLPGNTNRDDPAVIDREKEIINRERTWFLCFAVDRSLSAQMGKPYTIREDWIIRNCRLWSLQRLSKPWDIGISALVDLQKTHSRQLDFLYSSTTSVSGLNTDIDYSSVLRVFNEQLEEWKDLWKARGLFGKPSHQTHRQSFSGMVEVEEEPMDAGPPSEEDFNARTLYFMYKQAPMRFGYVSLILNSFGLQHSLDHPGKAGADRGIYFSRCLQAARDILFAARDGMRPVLRYSPDTHFVMISYAAVFLLKLTRPIFQAFNDEENILQLVSDTAELLDDVAVNEMHTPALYASFLRALLQARRDRSTGANTPYGRSRATSPVEGEGVFPGGSKDTGAGQRDPASESNNDQNGTGNSNSQDGPDPLSAAARSAFSLPGMDGEGNNESGTLNGLDPNAFSNGGMNLPVDQMLNDSFWTQLLPPGFGAPLDQLSSVGMHPIGSNNGQSSNQQAPTGLTPSQTRASTPSMLNSFTSNIGFDWNSGSFS